MKARIIELRVEEIHDWDSFHTVFQRVFGFLDGYGRNMDAWIDCMTDLDDPGTGMVRVSVGKDEIVVLEIYDAGDFKRRCPEQYEALIECTAAVNRRHVDQPVIALMFIGHYEA